MSAHAKSLSAEIEPGASEATERAIQEMDRIVRNEVKLRYITHIFAKTLDEIADWLDSRGGAR